MPNYNKVILMGNLTRDPETRVTPNGTTICKIGMAINRKWKDTNGVAKEEATYIDCDAFGRTAEILAKWTSKGNPVMVEGRLRNDQWDDKKTGEKRSKTSVTIESVQLISTPSDARHGQTDTLPGQNAATERPTASEAHLDDDVPF